MGIGPAARWNDGHDDYWMIENPIVRVRYDFRHDADGNYLLFVHEIQPPQPENQKLMPDLFLKNWRELGIKYALKVAVENGAAGVALATGQQQIDLYPSVEQEVRCIEWERRDAQTAFSAGEPVSAVHAVELAAGAARSDIACARRHRTSASPATRRSGRRAAREHHRQRDRAAHS